MRGRLQGQELPGFPLGTVRVLLDEEVRTAGVAWSAEELIGFSLILTRELRTTPESLRGEIAELVRRRNRQRSAGDSVEALSHTFEEARAHLRVALVPTLHVPASDLSMPSPFDTHVEVAALDAGRSIRYVPELWRNGGVAARKLSSRKATGSSSQVR